MAKKDDKGYLHAESNGRFVSKDEQDAKREEAKKIYDSDSGPIIPRSDDFSAKEKSPSIDEILGEEFKGYKGQAAIDKLLQEKHGHVKGAFHRDDIGDIDLLWGNDRLGLQHIILQRRKEKETEEEKVRHVNELLSNLGESIEKAHFKKKNNRGNFEFQYEKSYIVIAPEYHGNQITYVLTAYKRN